MQLSTRQRVPRLALAAFFVISGLTTFAIAQGNTSCVDSCSNKCSNCSTCPSVGTCCPNVDSLLPNPDSLLPSPSPLDMDPSTRPLTMPDPANPNAAPNADPPGQAFAFSPLQSSLGTPDQVAVPNMMGNLLRAYRGVSFQYLAAGDFATANSSGSVTFRNSKIAENNSAIPRDRVSFRYNYFRNSLTVRGLQSFGPEVTRGGIPPADFDLNAVAAAVGESRVARGVGNGGDTSFRGVAPASRDYDIHLYTFAVEKTFLEDRASIEVRVPYAAGLSEDQDLNGGIVTEDYLIAPTPGRTLGASGGEFQDVQLILKGILAQDTQAGWTISTGLGLTLPTGPNLNTAVTDFSGNVPGDPGDRKDSFPEGPYDESVNANGQGFSYDLRVRDFKIENETFELSPFIAAVIAPNSRTFLNSFAQIDLPLNKSDWRYDSLDVDLSDLGVTNPARPDPGTTNLARPFTQNVEQFSGSIRDQTLLHLDIGGGYWLYQNSSARLITGLASIIELHYTTTLQDADIVTVPASRLRNQVGQAAEPAPRLGNIANRVDILDLTIGGHFQIGRRATLAVGGVFPLRDGNDRTFDAEVNAQLNIYR